MSNSVYNRVFVLGSGFSKSFCDALPTLKDLNALIPERIPSEFPNLKAYCERFFKLCNGESEYLTIESLATAILSTNIFFKEADELSHSILRFELLRFIATSIAEKTPLKSKFNEELVEFLSKIVNSHEKDARKTLLISFNYDSLIENAVQNNESLSKSVHVDYGLHLENADRSVLEAPTTKTIDLLKLHGSLDWYLLKGASRELNVQSICRVRPSDKSYPIYKGDTPVFIPMAHSKTSFLRGSLFNILWAKADFYLQTAEKIYCIGYGFPKTDINNLEFLLKHRDRIAKVVVYEPEENPDLKRVERLFGANQVLCQDAKTFLKNYAI